MGIKGGLLAALGIVVVGAGVVSATTGGDDTSRGEVVRVVDGDTVVIKIAGVEEKVRLLNIDTPETVDPGKSVQCLGPEATDFLERLLEPGDEVELGYDIELRDRYERLLAGVFEDGKLVNAEIARAGLGHPVIFEPNVKFYDEVEAAYDEAEAEGVGYFDPSYGCSWQAQEDEVARAVADAEATSDPEKALAKADEAGVAAVALLALVDAAEPGRLSGGGLSAVELTELRGRVTDLQTRAAAAKSGAEEAVAEAEEKAREEERRQEEERQAKEAAEAKAAEEAARKEAEEKAAEAARQEAEARAAEEAQAREAEEAERRAAEEKAADQARNQQIQPLVPQHPAPAPAPVPAPAPAPAPAPVDVYYQNCDAARAAGAAPLYVGSPGYRGGLDRDKDGVACE